MSWPGSISSSITITGIFSSPPRARSSANAGSIFRSASAGSDAACAQDMAEIMHTAEIRIKTFRFMINLTCLVVSPGPAQNHAIVVVSR